MEKVITGLKLNARRQHIVDVFLDEAAQLKLMKSVAMSLRVGQVLSSEEIEDLQRRSNEEKLYHEVVGLLSRRPRSEQEIRQRYIRRNVPDETLDNVITRLREADLLDDLAFAKAWVENRNEFRPRSGWAIKLELMKKGVSTETIEEALSDFDDETAAYKAAAVGARKYKNLDGQLFHKRLGAYLARRGFQYHLVSPAIEHEWSELAGNDEESEVSK
jgi:regulatory protein